jgi:hypothetical protein
VIDADCADVEVDDMLGLDDVESEADDDDESEGLCDS